MDAQITKSKPEHVSRLRRVSLYVGALIPFGLAVCFHLAGPAAQSVGKGADRPPLVFSQYMVHLGNVPAGRKYASARFLFVNQGSETITLKSPVASCQCINPRLKDSKLVYGPGERGELYVSIETPKESPGEKAYTISVPYEDREQRQAELTFRAILPEPQVMVHPKGLMFYQMSGQEGEDNVTIIDNRAAPLNILEISSSTELATAELAEVVDDEGVRSVTIHVRVDGTVPRKRLMESIIVRTDDPEYGLLQIPLMIDGRQPTAPLISEPFISDDPRSTTGSIRR